MTDEIRERPLHGRRRRCSRRLLHEASRFHAPLERGARVRRRRPRSTACCCSAGPRARPAERCPTAASRSPAAGTGSTSSSTTSPPRPTGCASSRTAVPQRHRRGPGGSQILVRRPVRQPDRALPTRRAADRRTGVENAGRGSRRRCVRSHASGVGSAASGSAARRPTSPCCAICASSAGGWLTADEFEDAVAACNLLPGPASTQLAIYCARRVRGRRARSSAASRSSFPAWC